MPLKILPSRLLSVRVPNQAYRQFSGATRLQAKNRIYPSRIRQEDELNTLTLMSASSRVPLLTFWMATWCQTCKTVSPMIQELIEKEGVGKSRAASPLLKSRWTVQTLVVWPALG